MSLEALAAKISDMAKSHKSITAANMGESYVQVAIFGNSESVTCIHMVRGTTLPKSLMESLGAPKIHIVPKTFAVAEISHWYICQKFSTIPHSHNQEPEGSWFFK